MYPGLSDFTQPTTQYSPTVNVTTATTSEFAQGGGGTMFTPSGGTTSLNYTNNTSGYMRMLSGAERKELEVPRELFVNIKMLDLLEKAFTFGKTDEVEHHNRTEGILSKIERLTQILKLKNPRGNIDTFIEEYGLKECTWAIERIHKVKEPTQGQSVHALVASVTSGFIRLPDYLYMHEDDAQVKSVLPMLQEMKQLLDQLKPHFGKPGQPFNLSDRYVPLIQKLSGMELNDILSKKLAEEIQDVNEFTKNTFQIYLR